MAACRGQPHGENRMQRVHEERHDEAYLGQGKGQTSRTGRSQTARQTWAGHGRSQTARQTWAGHGRSQTARQTWAGHGRSQTARQTWAENDEEAWQTGRTQAAEHDEEA
eukprot:CAMPEP_0119544362 /NCGR_PEP_ID=MMETSP1344-20130328/54693_1 /TAXON_ID=236787 /ORGANISM="Florenciella parvula, Strain CCMP2471" /LENGTH=108 /DNA_ID=CAMNT_0007588861 /DNA_START=37 /DNA_END=363 /DNA_ORIENTATION=+